MPNTEDVPIIRTDYSDDSVWESLSQEINTPVEVFLANVEFISDPSYANMTKDQVIQRLPRNFNHLFIMIVDHVTISHPDHPLSIVDVFEVPGREFRAIPSQIGAIENNLSISNMDFEEFSSAVDSTGVFRGFE